MKGGNNLGIEMLFHKLNTRIGYHLYNNSIYKTIKLLNSSIT